MKLVIAGITLSGLLAMSAAGQIRIKYVADIPFGFHVGSTSYAAGHYKLLRPSLTSPEGWQITGDRNVNGLFFAMQSEPPGYAGGAPVLRFNCYGRTCFLSAIRGVETEAVWSLTPSLLERETARRSPRLEARAVPLRH
jgi:hypothetical protein